MANICDNIYSAFSRDKENINTILNYFHNWPYSEIENSGESVDVYFSSRWTFPEKEMNELFEIIPNKDDIHMRCLSYEFGNLYHALWICDEDGWREV